MTAVEAPAEGAVVQRQRRGVELLLLFFALVIAVGAYVNVGLGATGAVPLGTTGYAAGLITLAAVAHVVIRRVAPYADPILLPLVVMLNGLGLALIYRLDLAAAARAQAAGRPVPEGDAPVQLTWMVVGVVLFVAVLLVVRDHRILQRFTYTAGLAGLALLLLPLVPGLGVEINGARIWIRFAGFSFQPGEAAKIVLIVAFAGYLVATKDALALTGRRFLGLDLPRGRVLGPILVVWASALMILVFENDLGPSLLLFGVFVLMIYIATERISWLVLGALMAAVGAWGAVTYVGHVQDRIDAWLDPFSDLDRFGQIVQALYGFAYGGILGTGLGQGRPDLVPYAKSDFILVPVGEELGLTGLMAVLLVYLLVAQRGLRTALLVRDPFGKLLAAGLAIVFALQVVVVAGGVTGLLPLTGLTTPFLSLGGSSLVMNWALVALLLRISHAARQPPPPPPPALDEAMTQAVRIP